MEFGATLADVGWAAEDGQARLAVEDVRQSLPKDGYDVTISNGTAWPTQPP